jgi:hypothetical protein
MAKAAFPELLNGPLLTGGEALTILKKALDEGRRPRQQNATRYNVSLYESFEQMQLLRLDILDFCKSLNLKPCCNQQWPVSPCVRTRDAHRVTKTGLHGTGLHGTVPSRVILHGTRGRGKNM